MTAYSKQLIIFDLDGTLTVSKSPVDQEMADLIVKLLERKCVAVISGGGFPQFQKQFLACLPGNTDNYSKLLLMPTSGTRLFIWRGNWIEQYAENLMPVEKQQIMSALDTALKIAKYENPAKVFGPLVEDRGSQITFSALGQSAPVDLKYAWDPTRVKRTHIASILSEKLSGFEVRVGGATSIDITRRGINKGYGIRKLEQFLDIQSDDIVFVGDALFYGGNDYPAKATGIDCISVKGPEDTKALIKSWLV